MEAYLIPDPVANIRTVGNALGGEMRSIGNPLPMTALSSTTSPLSSPHKRSEVDPGNLFTRN